MLTRNKIYAISWSVIACIFAFLIFVPHSLVSLGFRHKFIPTLMLFLELYLVFNLPGSRYLYRSNIDTSMIINRLVRFFLVYFFCFNSSLLFGIDADCEYLDTFVMAAFYLFFVINFAESLTRFCIAPYEKKERMLRWFFSFKFTKFGVTQLVVIAFLGAAFLVYLTSCT